jgi:acetoin utilization deacetylase AcuC-like enzyme
MPFMKGRPMKKTGYLHDLRYMQHDTGPYHPEKAERLSAIHKGIEKAGLLPHLVKFSAVTAGMRWILDVHTKTYVRRFEELSLSGVKTFDSADNQMCTDTFEVARLAVGGVLETARNIMTGEIDNAFCAVRPPGHHAEVCQAMGFCYFNNVAICARYLQKRWKIKRVAIIDIDVHHGNGTQHIFENDSTVFYYSIHQHPSFAFPGTGRDFEEGIEAGKGYTKNSPALPGQGDGEYHRLFTKDLFPAMDFFKPEFIIVSTGFDAHEDDDMADMRLTSACFTWMMEQIMVIAAKYSQGRVLSVLEGGYALHRLPELARNHVQVLLNG